MSRALRRAAALAAALTLSAALAATAPPAVVTVPAGSIVNVRSPQRLDLTGVTPDDCDRSGGTYDLAARVCRGVDY